MNVRIYDFADKTNIPLSSLQYWKTLLLALKTPLKQENEALPRFLAFIQLGWNYNSKRFLLLNLRAGSINAPGQLG